MRFIVVVTTTLLTLASASPERIVCREPHTIGCGTPMHPRCCIPEKASSLSEQQINTIEAQAGEFSALATFPDLTTKISTIPAGETSASLTLQTLASPVISAREAEPTSPRNPTKLDEILDYECPSDQVPCKWGRSLQCCPAPGSKHHGWPQRKETPLYRSKPLPTLPPRVFGGKCPQGMHSCIRHMRLGCCFNHAKAAELLRDTISAYSTPKQASLTNLSPPQSTSFTTLVQNTIAPRSGNTTMTVDIVDSKLGNSRLTVDIV